jgi:hypothetical protein
MKSTIFVKPNLKLFLLGAILLAVVQHLIANGDSQASALPGLFYGKTEVTSNHDLQQLLAAAETNPTSQVYRRISSCLEQRGETRKAISYLRKAEFLARQEELMD